MHVNQYIHGWFSQCAISEKVSLWHPRAKMAKRRKNGEEGELLRDDFAHSYAVEEENICIKRRFLFRPSAAAMVWYVVLCSTKYYGKLFLRIAKLAPSLGWSVGHSGLGAGASWMPMNWGWQRIYYYCILAKNRASFLSFERSPTFAQQFSHGLEDRGTSFSPSSPVEFVEWGERGPPGGIQETRSDWHPHYWECVRGSVRGKENFHEEKFDRYHKKGLIINGLFFTALVVQHWLNLCFLLFRKLDQTLL